MSIKRDVNRNEIIGAVYCEETNHHDNLPEFIRSDTRSTVIHCKVGVIKLNQAATKDSRLHAPTEQRYEYQIRGSLFNFLVVSDLKI